MQLGRFLSPKAPARTRQSGGREYSLRLPLYGRASRLSPLVCQSNAKDNDGVPVYIPLPDIHGHLELSNSPVGRRCFCQGRVYRIDGVRTGKSYCHLTMTRLRTRTLGGFVPAGTVFVVAKALKALSCPTMRGKYEIHLGGGEGSGIDQISLPGFEPTASDLREWQAYGKPVCPVLLLRQHVHGLSNGDMRGAICQVGSQVFEILQNGDGGQMRILVLKPRPDLEPFAGNTYAEYKHERSRAGRCRSASGRARRQRRARSLMKRVRREHGLRA